MTTEIVLAPFVVLAYASVAVMSLVKVGRALGASRGVGEPNHSLRFAVAVCLLGVGAALTMGLVAKVTAPLSTVWSAVLLAVAGGAAALGWCLAAAYVSRRKEPLPLGYPPGRWNGFLGPLLLRYRLVARFAPLAKNRVSFAVTFVPGFLRDPLQSAREVALWYAVLSLGPYLLLVGSHLLIGPEDPPSIPRNVVVAHLVTSGVGAPILEEPLFRWFALAIGGTAGLFIGSVGLWAPLHLFFGNADVVDAPWLLPLLFSAAFFYARLWRGPYYWLSFGFHGLDNAAVVLVSSYVTRIGY